MDEFQYFHGINGGEQLYLSLIHCTKRVQTIGNVPTESLSYRLKVQCKSIRV